MSIFRNIALISALSLSAGVFAAQPVDINNADAQALADAIKGVGLKRAESIVAYRQKNGAFTTVSDLSNVQGIGEKTVQSSRENLTVKKAQ
ncbi:MAG: competence protein ComEA [Gammaproteobacteria bacterium]|jgi:competence protein ComEA